jgi:hypothetical protein
LDRRRIADGAREYLSHHETGKLRRTTGYCYHHRFNAETSSTYDRCLEELRLFWEDVAQPWFALQATSMDADQTMGDREHD